MSADRETLRLPFSFKVPWHETVRPGAVLLTCRHCDASWPAPFTEFGSVEKAHMRCPRCARTMPA